MRRADFIALDHFAQFPAGDDIGDAAVLFHAADNDLGDQLAVPADEQFALLFHALIVADVQHDEIPLRIHHDNFAP